MLKLVVLCEDVHKDTGLIHDEFSVSWVSAPNSLADLSDRQDSLGGGDAGETHEAGGLRTRGRVPDDAQGLLTSDHARQRLSVLARGGVDRGDHSGGCLLYTSPSPRDVEESRMPSSA